MLDLEPKSAPGRGRADAAAPTQPSPEKRLDGSAAFTRGEFMEFYGGLDEWHAAPPAPPPDEDQVKTAKNAASATGKVVGGGKRRQRRKRPVAAHLKH